MSKQASDLHHRMAELLGWTCVYFEDWCAALIGVPPVGANIDQLKEAVLEENDTPGPTYYVVPCWPEDLNLMQELERGLSEEEWGKYINVIWAAVEMQPTWTMERYFLSVTALQKARAWVQVKEG